VFVSRQRLFRARHVFFLQITLSFLTNACVFFITARVSFVQAGVFIRGRVSFHAAFGLKSLIFAGRVTARRKKTPAFQPFLPEFASFWLNS
jgi:hypothetical protein